MVRRKIIGVFSAKGGVGKTTTTIILGKVLQEMGKDVLIVDGNLSAPDLSNWLKINPEKHLHGALRNEYPIFEAVFVHESGLMFIPGSRDIDYLVDLNLFSIEPLIKKLKDYSEIILVDTPPGRNEEVIATLRAIDEAIIIVNPEWNSVENAIIMKELIERMNKDLLGMIIVENKKYKKKLKKEEIINRVKTRLIGYIPFHKDINKANVLNDIDRLFKPKKIWREYVKVAARVLGPSHLEEMLREDEKNPLLRYARKHLGLK